MTVHLSVLKPGTGYHRRTAALLGAYAAVICVSLFIAYEVRFDFVVPEQHQQERIRLLPLVLGIKLITLVLARQLGSLLTYFSIPDLIRLFWAMAASSLLLLVPRFTAWADLAPPRGVVLADFLLCFGALCAGRITMRLYRERMSGAKRTANGGHAQQQRIAIIGAGDAGASLAKEFLGHPSRGFRPVMFFDDDVEKHGKLVHGIPVIGRPESLHQAKELGTISKAVIAMPSASARRIAEIVKLFTAENIKVETLPSLEELASGRVRASRIRPVEVQDLLGRETVDLDSSGIKQAIENRVVLVTGAGGSIGGELCRQIAALHPKRLLLVEQAEGALFLIEQELNELGVGATIVPLVADILDRDRMEFVFARYRPEIVFHAAAHKHVFMMERQPAEAIRNNVLGTRQLAEIASEYGTDAFTLISTDKAINPTNVMGATKRLAELQLMAVAAKQGGWSDDRMVGASEVRGQETEGRGQGTGDRGQQLEGASTERKIIGFQVAAEATLPSTQSKVPAAPSSRGSQLSALSSQLGSSNPKATKFMAVRFGNVLGSSGSVIPIFKRQIAHGGPVTVTHPDVTRYFMTIPEAVGLVLQSFVQGKGGEIFVLDMGQPVKIVDLAKQMIELSGFRVGEDIEIKFTGLKPGEKLFEELQHHSEAYSVTQHPRIMQFRPRSASGQTMVGWSDDRMVGSSEGAAWTDDGRSEPRAPLLDEAAFAELERNLYAYDSNQLKEMLKKLVPEYTPFLD